MRGRQTAVDAAGGAQSMAEIDLGRLSARYGLPVPFRQQVRQDRRGRRRYLDGWYRRSDGRVIHLEVDGGVRIAPPTPRSAYHSADRVTKVTVGSPSRGLFIAFEGGEGTGKSTQSRLLARHLQAQGLEVLMTFEPGDSEAGAAIRALVLDPATGHLAPRAEALLYAADRAHHVATVVRPALDHGTTVLTDRYIDSSLAYQGAGRTLAIDEVEGLSLWATEGLLPDLTVLLDIDPEVGLRRAGRPDRLEAEPLAFHQRVREAFLQLAQRVPARYCVLDADRPRVEVAADVAAVVDALRAVPA